MSFFTLAITTLFADLNSSFHAHTGLTLPNIPSHDTEYSDSYPQLRRVTEAYTKHLENEPSDKKDAESFNPFLVQAHEAAADSKSEGPAGGHRKPERKENLILKAEFAAEIWDILSEAIFDHFPEHAPAIMSYASWKYKMDEPADEIDWRVRPPVGEAFAKAFRSTRFSSSSRAGATAAKPGRNGSDSFQKKERFKKPEGSEEGREMSETTPDPQQHAQKSARKPHSEREEGGRGQNVHRERSPSSAKPFEKGRGRERRPDRDSSENLIQSDEDLQPWLDEAKEAIALLSAQPELAEVALRPSNSYVRRLQHSLVVELGYVSQSRGEGKDRKIFVLKPTN